jgi:uracil-DNA glycosylase family 4
LQNSPALARLAADVTRCRRCPRLVRHREAAGANPPKRYRGQTYWARPLPGFGDPSARVLLVGLAPAANGGNRTGRMFTGDESGNWLFEALHAAGFANQPTSVTRDDGLVLRGAWITAALRCAPPLNKPTRQELARCQPFLLTELRLLTQVRVVVALGRIGWENYLRARKALGWPKPLARPTFGHGALTKFEDGTALLASYHPSQQNTFTGKLTKPMLRSIFETARRLVESPGGASARPSEAMAAARRISPKNRRSGS